MIRIFIALLFFTFLFGQADEASVQDIIQAMDDNLNAKSRVMTSKMIVHGRRTSRTIESVSYTHLTLPTLCSV